MKPKRAKTISKLKKETWNAFSKYIRLRDCLLTTGTKEHALCFTCGNKFHFKELQAGHLVDGRYNSILFDEDGVHAQCLQCNYFKSGNKEKYIPKMIELYGMERVKEIQDRKNIIKRFDRDGLIKLKEYYETEYKDAYANN